MPPRRRVSFELPSLHTTSAKLTAALIVCSVVGYILEHRLQLVTLSLVPGSVITDGKLWQLVTFLPLYYSPMVILFGGIILWQMGGYLEAAWGPRRLFTVSVTVVLMAAVVIVAASFFIRPLRNTGFEGGWALAGSIWVLYGLHLGSRQANFWGIPLTGNGLAAIGAGLVVLMAVFDNPARAALEGMAVAFSWGYMRVGSPRTLWLRAQAFWQERQLKRRSKRLRMISGSRNMPSDSDRYLH